MLISFRQIDPPAQVESNMLLKINRVYHPTSLSLCILIIFISISFRLSPVTSYVIGTPRDAMMYLQRFGYTQDGMAKQLVSSGRREEGVQRMITEFQALMGLRVSGKLDAPTIRKMNTKRCGNLDMFPNMTVHHGRKKRWVVNGGRWTKPHLTYAISKPSSSSHQAKVPMNLVKREIEKAIKLWEKASNITFTAVPHDGTILADIEIRFERQRHSDMFPFDGPGQTVAHAFPPGVEDINGDIHFDDDEEWYFGDGADSLEYENFAWTAAHELGHALGLAHSDIPGSIMQPEVQDYDPNMKLHEDDIEAIQELYGPPSKGETLPNTSSSPRKRTYENVGRANPCDSNFALNAITNDETGKTLYLFYGNYVYRMEYPITSKKYNVSNINYYFKFPATAGNRVKIDAAFTDSNTGMIYLFQDTRTWTFQNGSLSTVSLPITQLFPEYPPYLNVDAAFNWKGAVFLIKNNIYWEYQRTSGISKFHLRSSGNSLDPWLTAVKNGNKPRKVDAAFATENKVYLFGKRFFWSLVPTSRGRPKFTAENPHRQFISEFFKC